LPEKNKLKIGIDASRAFVKERTGIEEYSYQVIKHLRKYLGEHQVILYTRFGGDEQVDFELPKKWQVKILPWKYFWTQGGLSWEMLVRPMDILFVPAHTLPFIHPRRSYVTVHGLEYEFSPESYSWQSRLFHRFFIKRSCRWAEKVIAVSEKTKKDLVNLYKVREEKIEVIGNGFAINLVGDNNSSVDLEAGRFLFYLGRLEERKNIVGIVEAFDILKEEYGYEGKLLLGGGKGHGYDKIAGVIEKSKYRNDIVELGFVSNGDRFKYYRQADAFLFPSFFEGFGIPILEAQSVGTPVITSNVEPLKGVVGDKRVIVNPHRPAEIAQKVNEILKDEKLRKDIIEKGLKNTQRFSWDKTAEKIGRVLLEK